MAITPDNNPDTATGTRVQDRLLDAAEGLFCERGFDGTTIRDIAAAADCNIAAVNYYFGGKENLYAEVWRRHLKMMREIRLTSIDKVMSQSEDAPPLEDLLTSFANAFVEPLADKSKTKLMTREMLDRHLPSNLFVDELIKPTMAAMHKALAKTCPTLDPAKVPYVVFCLAGQLVHVVHVRAMFDEQDQANLPIFDLDEAVKHIVKFSAAGIRAFAKE
ncbi:MAG: CerR family C-terminal domain-containing protein [Planctomycetota bacterium]|jgi:AcrR family transcriptional regulator